MRIAELNWMQVEEYLAGDDRIVLPVGCTEQHAYLSLATDTILAERVAVAAAEPLGVPVLPPIAYGVTPWHAAFPGTVSIGVETLVSLVRDVLEAVHPQGFRRVLVVNGHGGNTMLGAVAGEWMARHRDGQAIVHDWWAGRPREAARSIDPLGRHASWFENYAWTRLSGVDVPDEVKPHYDEVGFRSADPERARRLLGDGNYGGSYVRPDADMERIWQAGVEEVRELLERGWG